MRAIFYDGHLQWRENYPQPVGGAGEALIRVCYAGICNTDMEIMKGYKGYSGILGHEFVGVVEVADDPGWIGCRVVADINVGCGICMLCRKGKAHHCRSRQVLGIFGKDGAFADYLTLPIANLYRVPESVSDQEAVFAEPLAAALEITEQIHVRPSQRVAVLGDGKLGQLVTMVLSLTGCQLLVIGKHADKLQRLAGWAQTHQLAEVNIAASEWAGAFDVVVDCTGQASGLLLASALTEPGGMLLLKSTFQGNNQVNATDWVVKELTVTGSRCGPMAAALRLLERRQVNVLSLIGAVYPLSEWQQAFEDRRAGKILLRMIS